MSRHGEPLGRGETLNDPSSNVGDSSEASDYGPEIRHEIGLTLSETPPGAWAELALCPGPFGCLYETLDAALAGGVEETFCPACRVIILYRGR